MMKDWCIKTEEKDNSVKFKSFMKIIEHIYKAIVNMRNSTTLNDEKRKIKEHIEAFKKAPENINAALLEIKKTLVKDPVSESGLRSGPGVVRTGSVRRRE